MVDSRYKDMKCKKCGNTQFLFTVLQTEELVNGDVYHYSTISGRCECGEEVQISKLVTHIERRYEKKIV